MYVLKDLNGEEVKGVFYEEELSPVIIKPTTLYPIDKILETSGKCRNKKYFVSRARYPSSFNSASEIENIAPK